MLVEINLLPQKETNKRASHLMIILFSLLILIVGLVYFWQIHTEKQELSSVEKQINMTEKAISRANANSTTSMASSDSAAKLKSAIEWADTYPIKSIPVIEKLTKLLPERGFIQTFSYSDTSVLSLTVQFDMARDAAYFLNNLSESNWITEVNLISVTTNESVNESESTENSQNESNTSESNSSEEEQATSDNENTSGTEQEQQTTSQNRVTQTQLADSIKSGDEYLPRYIGQYEIKLNKTAIKNETDEEKAKEGVSES